ncbi:hypothetical protein C2G38_2207928 [Gigaspora rosea]|uniref:Uncharacterized protein n=1 Tax=Gigaspora rosea TaxID=44941 RepID=A0A397UHJ1_9GLOM|nr:hypothetical protein C2G38_2207928 [Gigaspora rosea]
MVKFMLISYDTVMTYERCLGSGIMQDSTRIKETKKKIKRNKKKGKKLKYLNEDQRNTKSNNADLLEGYAEFPTFNPKAVIARVVAGVVAGVVARVVAGVVAGVIARVVAGVIAGVVVGTVFQ